MIKPKPAGGGWATVEIKISPARAIQRNVYLYMIYIYICIYIYIYMCSFARDSYTAHLCTIFGKTTSQSLGNPFLRQHFGLTRWRV